MKPVAPVTPSPRSPRRPGHQDTHDDVSFKSHEYTADLSRRSLDGSRLADDPSKSPYETRSGINQRMDPLSEVLALMQSQLYVAGGFAVPGEDFHYAHQACN